MDFVFTNMRYLFIVLELEAHNGKGTIHPGFPVAKMKLHISLVTAQII